MVGIKVVFSVNPINGKITVNLNLTGCDFKDVHTFDEQYKHNIITKYNKEIKFKKFKKLLDDINDFKLTESTNGLQRVINDTETNFNFDMKNNLKADDILIEIIELLENGDKDVKLTVYTNLLEQMNDMLNLGQCQQGRINRLIQIYNFLAP
jgi:hypothetical protein